MYPSGSCSFNIVNCVNLSKILIDLDHFQCSNYFKYGALAIDPRSCVYPGDVNVSKWNWEWFIFRHMKFDSWLNLMALI